MMLGIDGQEQLVNFLVDLLQSESAPARRAAARALGLSIRPVPDPGGPPGSGPAAVERLAVESLTAALRDPDALVRSHAADALRAFSAPASLPSLLPMLQDPEEEVRFAAAVAAGDLGAPQSLPVLLEALRRGPPHRRRQAAASLGTLGAAASVPALMDALGDPSRVVQERAAVALGTAWETPGPSPP
ncbi:MAG: HEAT repeat domain-containing protein [Chloroflexi bacterium]|nr:HEAT repeat domain-containing protein [Chloroflexota bacterium]